MTAPAFHPVIALRRHLPVIIRWRDIILTIALWWMFALFMRGFFVFFIDVGDWAWHGFTDAGKYESFKSLPTFLTFIESTAVFFIVYIGWARYNQHRFRGKGRRRAADPVSFEELAHFYRLDEDAVKELQQARHLVFHHDQHGHITHVDVNK